MEVWGDTINLHQTDNHLKITGVTTTVIFTFDIVAG